MSSHRCLLLHDWSQWGAPFNERRISVMVDNVPRKFVRLVQERTCQRCGAVMRRTISR